MCRKEDGSCVEYESIDLQFLQDYEKTGCKLKQLLEDCKKQDIHIAFLDKTVDPDWMMNVYKMIIKREREELKVEQYAGIQRALKKKNEGTGKYGRPRVELPADFEYQLKSRMKGNEDLSHYCAELNMKKSTFYKWVKVYRDSWDDG